MKKKIYPWNSIGWQTNRPTEMLYLSEVTSMECCAALSIYSQSENCTRTTFFFYGTHVIFKIWMSCWTRKYYLLGSTIKLKNFPPDGWKYKEGLPSTPQLDTKPLSNKTDTHTGEFTERAREMSSQFFVCRGIDK